MVRGALLSPEERAKVDILQAEGYSLRGIGKALKRSRHAVTTYLKDRKTYGKGKGGAWKKKMSDKDKRMIVREVAKGHFTASQLKARLDLPVGTRRVQQVLNESSLTAFKKLKRAPTLTKKHKDDRLSWARTHHNWTPHQWSRVVFSDEKRFCMDGPDGFNYYWHHLAHDEEIMSRRQNGGGGIMIWAGFSEKGKTKIAFVSGNQNSNKYVDTLKEYLLPFVNANHQTGYIFQQDNASIHKSAFTTNWISSQRIPVMTWPAKSPDLNPIENLWATLARRVYANGRQFNSIPELQSAVTEEWEKIGLEELYALLRSMERRCVSVLERGGKYSGY